MIPKTKMATETEVEGATTVSVPPEWEAGLAQEAAPTDENQTAPPPQVEEKEEVAQEEVNEPQEEQPQGEEARPNRKERRIGEFVNKLKEKDKEVSALQEELNRLKGGSPPLPNRAVEPGFGLPPWEVPQFQPGEEVTPEQMQQRVIGAANTITDIKLNQFKANLAKVDAFKDDLRYVESTYDILNPDKPDSYNKEAAKKLTQLYQKASKGDPDLRLKDFVDDFMSFRQEGRNEGMREITPKVLKQQAEGAIPPSTPSGKRSGSVNPEDMTTDEMEAYLKENGLWDE